MLYTSVRIDDRLAAVTTPEKISAVPPCQAPRRFAIVRLPDEMVNKIKQLGPPETAVKQKKKLTVMAKSLIILPLRC
jgi:hypothetical protein